MGQMRNHLLINVRVMSQPCLHTLIQTQLLTNESACTILIIANEQAERRREACEAASLRTFAPIATAHP